MVFQATDSRYLTGKTDKFPWRTFPGCRFEPITGIIHKVNSSIARSGKAPTIPFNMFQTTVRRLGFVRHLRFLALRMDEPASGCA
jgi:hypothetical protein